MRLNIFRNPFMDAQVGYFLDSMIDARRKETEAYWRDIVQRETIARIRYRLEGETCFEDCAICDGVEFALMIIDDEFGNKSD